MDLKEELIDNENCIFIEKYNIMGINVYKFISIKNRDTIFALKKDDSFKKINNKLFLNFLYKKFDYKIKTDICENDDEKK